MAPGKMRSTAPVRASSTSSQLFELSGADDWTIRMSPTAGMGASTYPGVECFHCTAPVPGSNATTEPGSPDGVRPPAAYSKPCANVGETMLPKPPEGFPPTVGLLGSITARRELHTGPAASR